MGKCVLYLVYLLRYVHICIVFNFHRAKQKLLPKITELWTPSSCKKPCVSIRRLSIHGTLCLSLCLLEQYSDFPIKDSHSMDVIFLCMNKSLKDFLNLLPSELSQIKPEKSLTTAELKSNGKERKPRQVRIEVLLTFFGLNS